MRKLFILVFTIMTTCVFGQITTGQMTIQNMGNHYEIKKDNVVPVNNVYPYPDSSSIRISVLSSPYWESNNVSTTTMLKYKLKGVVLISSCVYWWKGNKRIGQTNMKTLCITGNSNLPTNGFLKI